MKKNCILAVVERLFWQLGTRFGGHCRCTEVAVVERFKQELMYGLSAGTKKSGRCGEVAVSGGSTVLKKSNGQQGLCSLACYGGIQTMKLM